MTKNKHESRNLHQNDMQVTVLLVTNEFGGHEKMLIEWLKEALQQGLHINIFCRKIFQLTEQCAVAGLHVDPLAYGQPERRRRFWTPLRDLATTFIILRRIPRRSIVLFAPGVVQTAPWHIFVASLLRHRVVSYVPMSFLSGDMGFRFAALRDWIVRHINRHVDIWVTITEQQLQQLKKYWGISKPVYVIPNRLQLPDVEPMVRSNLVEEFRPLQVLFLGRFERNQKGLDWLVTELRRNHSSWVGCTQFVFQGQGDYEYALRQLALEMPDGAIRVTPWGNVLPEMLKADVLLLPSRFEGFPLVAIEATHYGVPVVATNQSGLADILPSECLVPFGDFDALMKSIHRLRDPRIRILTLDFTSRRIQSLLSKDRFEQAVTSVVCEFSNICPDKNRTYL